MNNPFNDPVVVDKLEDILIKFGVDDRRMHAILAQIADVIVPKVCD